MLKHISFSFSSLNLPLLIIIRAHSLFGIVEFQEKGGNTASAGIEPTTSLLVEADQVTRTPTEPTELS